MAQVRVRPVYPLEGFCEDFGVTPATARRDALHWRDFYRDAGLADLPKPPRRLAG
jgi:hypothetical protein